ncbi:MAG: SprT family zinc-dependent metalloprotease [Pontiella sp.]
MQHRIKYGSRTIRFDVVYAARKSLQIEVYPDLHILVKAPARTDICEIEKRMLRRSRWMSKQLDYFRQFDPRTPARKYVGGETHLYLGRQYRLKILQAEPCGVKLVRGYFLVPSNGSSSPKTIMPLLDQWYAEKAAIQFHAAFERCWPKFNKLGLTRPDIQIRKMKSRWGSLSAKGRLTLNADLIRAPKECIDYVVTHELCHLTHHNHSPAFYELLEKSMPDWKKRKHRLELSLI